MKLTKVSNVGITRMTCIVLPTTKDYLNLNWTLREWLMPHLRDLGRYRNTILFDGLYEELIIADNSKELE